MLTALLVSLFALCVAAQSCSPSQGQGACSFVEAFGAINSPDGNITGWFDLTYDTFSGTWITVSIYSGLFNTSLQYPAHIHRNFISADGNCTSAGPHLNPMLHNDTCDPTDISDCQEGDETGKFGTINGTASGAVKPPPFNDKFVRFWPQPFSVLGRSVVIHHPVTLEYIACGNVTSCLDGTGNDDRTPTLAVSTYQDDYTTSSDNFVNNSVPLPPTVCYQDAEPVNDNINLIYEANCQPNWTSAGVFTWTSGAVLPTQSIPTCTTTTSVMASSTSASLMASMSASIASSMSSMSVLGVMTISTNSVSGSSASLSPIPTSSASGITNQYGGNPYGAPTVDLASGATLTQTVAPPGGVKSASGASPMADMATHQQIPVSGLGQREHELPGIVSIICFLLTLLLLL